MEKGPGFSKLLWDFMDGRPKVNNFKTTASVPASTPLVDADLQGAVLARLQIRRPDHRLRLHAGDRHGQRPSRRLPLSRELRQAAAQAAPQGQMTAKKTARDAASRAWQRMLSGRRLDLLDPSPLDVEIADIAHGLARVARWNGQTTARISSRSRSIRCWWKTVLRHEMPRVDRAHAARRPAARRARIRDRRHDLAVQGGDRRLLQGAWRSACSAPSTSASACRRCCPTRSRRRSRPPTAARPIWRRPSLPASARARRGACSARDPGLSDSVRRDYLTPWTAARAEKQFLERFGAVFA